MPLQKGQSAPSHRGSNNVKKKVLPEEIPIEGHHWLEFTQLQWDEPGIDRIETTVDENGKVIHNLITARDNEFATSRHHMLRTYKTISAGIRKAS